MSDVAIRVDGLGKRYQLGGGRQPHATLGEQVRRWATLRPLRDRAAPPPPFWALKDVGFEVKPGEVVGIVGRNGAGKSTLLKILSRITEPTEGAVDLYGRVGSLLEVGTGFHPELTGRENIALNGAILGMGRREVRTKFDEIVAFAEVEKFIDTPVKHYSSGMYTRLAFAVAAHLEPEILIVDEVLAVGDAEFQKKCLGKMGQVAKGGRTVLFVSHNTSAIQSLCTRAVYLQRGGVVAVGSVTEVLSKYAAGGAAGQTFERADRPSAPICVAAAEVDVTADDGGRVLLRVTTDLEAVLPMAVSLDLRVADATGGSVGFGPIGSFRRADGLRLPAGRTRVTSTHDATALADGVYFLSLDVSDPGIEVHDRVDQCVRFEVRGPLAFGCDRRLKQEWGYGCAELPYIGHTVSAVEPAAGE